MLKPSPQLSCHLSAQQLTSISPTKMNPNSDTNLSHNQIPPEIIRPKPRRMNGGANCADSQTQMSRHCTSSDLSQDNHMRSSPSVNEPAVGRPNTPMNPFRRDAVGGSAPVLSHLLNRRDGSPKYSLSPFQMTSPVKNISGRESASSGRSLTPQKAIKPIRETPPIKQPLSVSNPTSNPKPRNNSSNNLTQIQSTPKLYERLYMPSKSVNAIDEQTVCDGFEEEVSRRRTGHVIPNHHYSPSTTECGSLSKSSSDGDHIINKKKVLSKMKSRRKNILCFSSPATVISDDTSNASTINRASIHGKVRQGCYGGSSGEENRSSGHASMSDSHRSSYTEDMDSKLNQIITADHMTCAQQLPGHLARKMISTDDSLSFINPMTRHNNMRKSGLKARKKDQDSIFLANPCAPGVGHLEGVRAAIEQMSLRSHGGHSTSTYSSNYSGSEYEPTFRRLIRHSSLETINTNITSAGDDFVWIDSHSRLVELQHYPWNNHDVLRLLQQGRLKNQLNRISMESVPRLSYLLQRPLVRIASEAQRFAKSLGMCTKHEICGSIKVILSASLADSCIKAGHRAAAIFAVSGPDNFRQSKSIRAGLQFSVGKFHRWMCDVKMGNFVDEYAVIYLTSAMENLLEEIILNCFSMQLNEFILTANLLDTCIANNSDLWGLLQPFAHLNAGRTANGMLSLPTFHTNNTQTDSTGSSADHKNSPQLSPTKTFEQQLLTTCVGSVQELSEIIENLNKYLCQDRSNNPQSARKSTQRWWSSHTWSLGALYSLYYYMRCAQLEHNTLEEHQKVSQELVYERPYLVLPPLYEWMRVSSAQACYRKSQIIDKDDVIQSARILLPGIDCPPRQLNYTNSDEWINSRKELDKNECARRLKIELAFRMLRSGRTDLLSNALQLLPANYGLNTVNESGLTILMQSCIAGDTALVQMLSESGCNVNIETPIAPNHNNSNRYDSNIIAETQHWTALNYATIHGHIDIVTILLEKGANVDGGVRYGEDRVTLTPLQLASSSGRIDLVKLLLSYGADPFLSTQVKDSMSHCLGSRGCPSAIAVAAIHSERMILRTLLAHPLSNTSKEVLSLEEMLAESSAYNTSERRRIQIVAANQDPSHASNTSVANSDGSKVIQLTKSKLKALQEAMYHSAENGGLEITLDLRNIGVAWTLHTWMQTVANAHEMRLDAITDQLLQDFLHLWPDDCSSQFIDECIPLLFSIFRNSKNSGTALLLADIFRTCYGKEPVKPISNLSHIRGARIDAKYVNNKELSDCVFKVDNRVIYAHKIILVNASKRFQSMLTTNKSCDNIDENTIVSQSIAQSHQTPIVVNDIRFDIFLKVMQFLYNGGFDEFAVEQNDILELMSAANYLQLDSLLRYCEIRCSQCVTLDNVLAIYMNAILYNGSQLVQYCQHFILQNFVALLTYDSSLSELIFQTKHNNNDLLTALQFTLQKTIKERQIPPKNHFLLKSKNQLVL